ncbi:MAG TPA: acyltransferase family protein, partial [Terrimicrobiaceae bacterium]|nr:acyltransferase family protein [Terrimicrobiaceae bacterium]
FVGVDVFFVISGYLITSLISAEMTDGRYSVTNFYVRRARRIFPALFCMCAITALFVLLFGLPSDARKFSSSLAGATLFVSNIYFYVTADYFAAAAETQPLLHTWSLAVEEQFYIVFPLILLFIRQYFPIRQKQVVVALAILSFAISVWLVRNDRAGAFYLLHARAWELLLGALLAIGALPVVRSRALAGVLGLLGLALIIGSVLIYGEQTPFPGFAALPPCIGAALIIHTGRDASLPAMRALSFGPIRFIGLISYSLYLWHWPIAVMLRNAAFWYGWNPDLKPHMLAVLALSFVFAILSWRFVERPFRERPYRLGGVRILSASAAAMAVLVVAAGLIHPLSERFWKLPDKAARTLAVLDITSLDTMRSRSCLLRTEAEQFSGFDQAICLQMSGTKPNWLLIGDSHAADLWVGLARANPQVNLLQATATGCKPVLDSSGQQQCTDLMHFMLNDFIPKRRFEAILISARWTPGEIGSVRRTAKALEGYADRVIVLGPRVEYRQDLPWILTASILQNDPSIVNRFRRAKQKETDRIFAEQLRRDGITYVSVYRAICPGGRCEVTDRNGLPLAFDYGHLTESGSMFVARQIKRSGGL